MIVYTGRPLIIEDALGERRNVVGGKEKVMARILIAEDEANIFKLVSFRLKHLGHDVIWAQNGSQALKADADTQPIPVIMLTARGHEKYVVTFMDGGADDYSVKPFSFPELIARV